MDLYDDYGVPSWSDGQFFRACVLRLDRDDRSAWREFLERLHSDRNLTLVVRSILMDRFVVFEELETDNIELNLPLDVEPLGDEDKKDFLRLLNTCDPGQLVSPDPNADREFIPPSKELPGEIMYVEMKRGLLGRARIGRIRFSKTRKTLYYSGKKLQSLKGGYKANYYDVESGMEYWVSKCKKNGSDTLYPGIIEIDDDVREEYWTEIRKQPENKHLTKFRSPGKYSKRRPS